jgi:hypothetical protein
LNAAPRLAAAVFWSDPTSGRMQSARYKVSLKKSVRVNDIEANRSGNQALVFVTKNVQLEASVRDYYLDDSRLNRRD